MRSSPPSHPADFPQDHFPPLAHIRPLLPWEAEGAGSALPKSSRHGYSLLLSCSPSSLPHLPLIHFKLTVLCRKQERQRVTEISTVRHNLKKYFPRPQHQPGPGPQQERHRAPVTTRWETGSHMLSSCFSPVLFLQCSLLKGFNHIPPKQYL